MPPGFDGEIILPGKTFHEIQSKVMTQITLPFEFQFYCFDLLDLEKPYWGRNKYLSKNQKGINIFHLKHQQVDLYDLQRIYEDVISNGSEGLILRDPDAPYKQGRSTFNQEWMLKMKAFEESEGVIVGFEPEYKNNNEQTTDQTGASKRSNHYRNKEAILRLGRLLLRDRLYHDQTISVGTGFNHQLKKEIWENQKEWLGKIATYTHQPHGEKDAPRCAVFKGIRKD